MHETEDGLVCLGEETDERGQHVPEWGFRRRKRLRLVRKVNSWRQYLSLPHAGDDGSVGNVEWDHGFLDGNVEDDLRCFGWNVIMCQSMKYNEGGV